MLLKDVKLMKNFNTYYKKNCFTTNIRINIQNKQLKKYHLNNGLFIESLIYLLRIYNIL